MGIIFVLFMLFFFCLILLSSIFWIWMLIDCINNKFLTDTTKAIWVLVIVFTHFIGAVCYLLAGRKSTAYPSPQGMPFQQPNGMYQPQPPYPGQNAPHQPYHPQQQSHPGRGAPHQPYQSGNQPMYTAYQQGYQPPAQGTPPPAQASWRHPLPPTRTGPPPPPPGARPPGRRTTSHLSRITAPGTFSAGK